MSKQNIEILGERTKAYDEILSDGAMDFVASLATAFSPRVEELLAKRIER
ncbi:MAG: hypothetical protein ACE5KS_03960, partial [Woeseiaceae bacterium]